MRAMAIILGIIGFALSLFALTGCAGLMQLPTAPQMTADEYIQVMKLENAAGCSVATFRGAATPYADVVARAAIISVYGQTPPDLASCVGALPPSVAGPKSGQSAVVQPGSPVDRLIQMIQEMH